MQSLSIYQTFDRNLKPSMIGWDIKIAGRFHAVAKRRDKYSYSVVGGHVEDGEEPLQAALRELYEETGLSVNQDSVEEFPWQLTDGRIVARPYRLRLPNPQRFLTKDPDIERIDIVLTEEFNRLLEDKRFHPLSKEFYKIILGYK